MRDRRRIYRCSEGHVFARSIWWPLTGGYPHVRLGFAAYDRCPVGRHWALIKPVRDRDLTEAESETVAGSPVSRDGYKIGQALGLFSGLACLPMALATRTWWAVALGGVWAIWWGGLLVREMR